MVSAFRGVIEFFQDIGLYDVVLPFLLVFTIVFAILEKTRVFGMETIDGKQYTKKNLNSITAFVLAFFVIASSKLVEIITTVSSYTVILLLLSILFLLLVGSFMKEGEGGFLTGNWNYFFMIIMFIGIALIFIYALGWWDTLWAFFQFQTGGEVVGSIILIAIIVLFIWYIVKGEPHKDTTKK
ncbi:MAG: hypothetical protein KKC75_07980 [Nanoarchaeota archaeon]|nr:hypothetical protein [Nanoarchaeota archaeon]MBU1005268.1 hypothetical protein [Nanoarchaeota archaeon]MBU1947005.1 hypothetical protein [Nanoarchaeota archaeon]